MNKDSLLFIALIVSILGVFIGYTSGYSFILGVSAGLAFIILTKLNKGNFVTKIKTQKSEFLVREQLNDSSLEIISYSSNAESFSNMEHPLEELNSIDYSLSVQRQFVRGSIDDIAFAYHEEVLYAPKQIPVKNMFNGVVIEFDTDLKMPNKMERNNELLQDIYTVSYVYISNTNITFYIPIEGYLEKAFATREYKEEVLLMEELIGKLKKIYQELEKILKEEEK